MQKESECTDADTTDNFLFSCTVDVSGPDHHVGNAETLSILSDDLFLLDLGEAVGLAAQFAMLFDGAGFVQKPALWLFAV